MIIIKVIFFQLFKQFCKIYSLISNNNIYLNSWEREDFNQRSITRKTFIIKPFTEIHVNIKL